MIRAAGYVRVSTGYRKIRPFAGAPAALPRWKIRSGKSPLSCTITGHMGRPRTLNPTTVARIISERQSGRTFWRIADDLRADGTPTATGRGTWFPSRVREVVERFRPDLLGVLPG